MKPAKNRILITAAILPLLFTACSFVAPIPGSENIILATDDAGCEKMGSTTVTVLDKVGFISRSKETIEDELRTMAANSAYKMGGNAIWPDSDLVEGSQTFNIYRCRSN